jgi:hypothetical protein
VVEGSSVRRTMLFSALSAAVLCELSGKKVFPQVIQSRIPMTMTSSPRGRKGRRSEVRGRKHELRRSRIQ